MGTLSLSLFLASYLSLSFSLSISTPDIPSRHLHFDFDFFPHIPVARAHWYSKKEREEIFQKTNSCILRSNKIKGRGKKFLDTFTLDISFTRFCFCRFRALQNLPTILLSVTRNISIKKKRKETRYIRIISWKISISRKLNNYDSSKNPFSAI